MTTALQDRPTDRVGERLLELRSNVERLQDAKSATDAEQIEILFREDAKPSDQQKLARRSAELGRELSDARDQLARVIELHDLAVRTAAKAEFAQLTEARAAIYREWPAVARKLRAAVAEVGALSAQITEIQQRDRLLANSHRIAAETGHLETHIPGGLPYAGVFDPDTLRHRLNELDAAIDAATRS